jgi:mono/diheme cytochrome c family protein
VSARVFLGLALPLLGAAAFAFAQPDGRAIYEGKGNCASCHGRDGTGTRMGPDLTDGVWLHGDGSLAAIDSIIRNGVPEPVEAPIPMPPLGGAALTGDEVTAVAGYVHSLSR